jgi:hypothetical protein
MMLTAHYQLPQKSSYVNISFIANGPYIGRWVGMFTLQIKSVLITTVPMYLMHVCLSDS